jgi:predicted transcriptional regulator
MTTSAKKAALDLIESLPEDASFEDIMYGLFVREQVEAGLQDIRAGRTVSQDEVKQKVAEWRRSAGR